jgi:hypothetical protein
MYILPDLCPIVDYLCGLDDDNFNKCKDIVYEDYDKECDWDDDDDLEIFLPIFIMAGYIKNKDELSNDILQMPWHNRVLRNVACVYCGKIFPRDVMQERSLLLELFYFVLQAIEGTLLKKEKLCMNCHPNSLYFVI